MIDRRGIYGTNFFIWGQGGRDISMYRMHNYTFLEKLLFYIYLPKRHTSINHCMNSTYCMYCTIRAAIIFFVFLYRSASRKHPIFWITPRTSGRKYEKAKKKDIIFICKLSFVLPRCYSILLSVCQLNLNILNFFL
jgi:hypothetical protein